MLEIKGLCKYFGEVKAVDGLSLNVENGEICGFIGHNGAGKTTAIKCVVGLCKFNSGEIYIDGHSVKTDGMKCKQLIAYIPDNPDLYDGLTGIQYINFVSDAFGVNQQHRSEYIKKYGDIFEITHKLGDRISSYSHGMKQKVALIAALVHEPKLLVLDEPFVGLDPEAVVRLKQIMKEMCSGKCAVFFSTHVLDVAEKLCDKIVIIKQGKVIVSGKTEELTNGMSLEDRFMEVYGNASAD